MQGGTASADGVVLYCRLDTSMAMMDYQPQTPCHRFVGIEQSDFDRLPKARKQNDTPDAAPSGVPFSCSTFTVDVSYGEFDSGSCQFEEPPSLLVRRYPNVRWARWPKYLFYHPRFPFDFEDEAPSDIWMKLTFARATGKESGSYRYRNFVAGEPEYLTLKRFQWVEGSPVPFLPSFSSQIDATSDSPFSFYAFHVGQGMCSLVHNGKSGYLLDCGAGMPVIKPDYLAGKHKNQFREAIEKLEEISIIVSHTDMDHWRLLEWEALLYEIDGRVNVIYHPNDRTNLAFTDATVAYKVCAIGDMKFSFGPKSSLQVFRSSPKSPYRGKKNSECLISIFTDENGKRGECLNFCV